MSISLIFFKFQMHLDIVNKSQVAGACLT